MVRKNVYLFLALVVVLSMTSSGFGKSNSGSSEMSTPYNRETEADSSFGKRNNGLSETDTPYDVETKSYDEKKTGPKESRVFFSHIGDKDVGLNEYLKPERPLKILFVVGCFPLLPETAILNQMTGMIDRGHEVTIFAAHEGQKKMHPDVMKYELLDHAYFGELPPDLDSYDIILCQFGPLGKKFVKIRKELKLKAKIITCFRGYDITKEVQEKGRHVYDRLFTEGDLFLPVCYYFKDIMVDLGCDPDKIIVHRSAIDLDKFIFRSKKKGEGISIVSVNRLIPKKGTIYAINAVRTLLKKYPGIRYSIMGDGYLKRRLVSHISKSNVQRNIKLLGWGTQEEVIDLLQTADIFILPSLTASDGNEEGIPNALKEAMAVGIPGVSTYHAGIAELVDNGKTGFLVRCANSKDLAQKIEYLIEHPELRMQMGVAGRKRIEEEYETNQLNDRLEAILYKLLDR